MKALFLIASGLALVVAVLGAFAWTAPRSDALALAEYSVQNLSCGSCVRKVQNSLDGLRGVGAVEVSVTAGRARVEYLPDRTDAGTIAGRISAAGYPAVLIQELSATDYRALRDDTARLADRFVGRIGEKLVSRETYAAALSRREGTAEVPRSGLLRAVWDEVVQRELLLAAAEKNGVVVQEGEVDLELQKLRAPGRDEDFRHRLKEEMIIRRNLEEHVLKGEADRRMARLKLDRWYRALAAGVPVIIFDPALKAAVEGGGKGCGGSCCG